MWNVVRHVMGRCKWTFAYDVGREEAGQRESKGRKGRG